MPYYRRRPKGFYSSGVDKSRTVHPVEGSGKGYRHSRHADHRVAVRLQKRPAYHYDSTNLSVKGARVTMRTRSIKSDGKGVSVGAKIVPTVGSLRGQVLTVRRIGRSNQINPLFNSRTFYEAVKKGESIPIYYSRSMFRLAKHSSPVMERSVILQRSQHLRRVQSNKQLVYGHSIAHSGSWRKGVGREQQQKDIAFFHREFDRKGFHYRV